MSASNNKLKIQMEESSSSSSSELESIDENSLSRSRSPSPEVKRRDSHTRSRSRTPKRRSRSRSPIERRRRNIYYKDFQRVTRPPKHNHYQHRQRNFGFRPPMRKHYRPPIQEPIPTPFYYQSWQPRHWQEQKHQHQHQYNRQRPTYNHTNENLQVVVEKNQDRVVSTTPERNVDRALKYVTNSAKLCKCKSCNRKFTLEKSMEMLFEAIETKDQGYMEKAIGSSQLNGEMTNKELNKSTVFLLKQFMCLHCYK